MQPYQCSHTNIHKPIQGETSANARSFLDSIVSCSFDHPPANASQWKFCQCPNQCPSQCQICMPCTIHDRFACLAQFNVIHTQLCKNGARIQLYKHSHSSKERPIQSFEFVQSQQYRQANTGYVTRPQTGQDSHTSKVKRLQTSQRKQSYK